jgi:uncharacterized RDD family membrane protein YckC
MSFAELPQISPEASLGRRLLALVIDWTMCRLIVALLGPAFLPESSFNTLIIFFLEVALFTILFQASAGQRLMAVKVVSFPDQLRVSPQRVLLRTLLICLVLPAIFTKDGRAFHDHFTQSQTIREIY